MAIDSSSEEAKSQNVARRKSDFIIISVSASTTRAKKSSPSLPSPLAPTPLRENIANFLFPLPLPSQTNGRGRRCHLNSMREKKVDALRPFAVNLHKGPRGHVSSNLISCLAIHPLLYLPCLSAPRSRAPSIIDRIRIHNHIANPARESGPPPPPASLQSPPSLTPPSFIFQVWTDEGDRDRATGAVSPCVWLESQREAVVYLSARLTCLPALCLPSVRSFVRSYQPTATEATRPSVRPSLRPFVAPRGSTRE